MNVKRYLMAAAAVFALVLFGGCASLPSPELMRAQVAGYQLPKTPEPGKAMVYVVRPSAWGTLIRFNVVLGDRQDASEMGFTRGSQYVYFSVAPGTQNVFSKAENWAEISFSAQAGEVVFIQQDPAMGLIIARNNLVKIDDVTGKYHVMKLTRGTVHKTEK